MITLGFVITYLLTDDRIKKNPEYDHSEDFYLISAAVSIVLEMLFGIIFIIRKLIKRKKH